MSTYKEGEMLGPGWGSELDKTIVNPVGYPLKGGHVLARFPETRKQIGLRVVRQFVRNLRAGGPEIPWDILKAVG